MDCAHIKSAPGLISTLKSAHAAIGVAVAELQLLGQQPLAYLFHLVCKGWAVCECVCQRVLAVDGVVWATPDIHDSHLPLGSSSIQHGSGGWPQIRAVCLMDKYSHVLRDARKVP